MKRMFGMLGILMVNVLLPLYLCDLVQLNWAILVCAIDVRLRASKALLSLFRIP